MSITVTAFAVGIEDGKCRCLRSVSPVFLTVCCAGPTPHAAALGVDVTTWPPYISNLVFELWELPRRQGQGQAAAGGGSRFLVRVLYNRQELPLPHSPPGEDEYRTVPRVQGRLERWMYRTVSPRQHDPEAA